MLNEKQLIGVNNDGTVKVSYLIQHDDRNSLSITWFLSGETAFDFLKSTDYKRKDFMIGYVETFKGSDIHLEAIKSENMFSVMRS